MNKKEAAFGPGFIFGVVTFLIAINVIYTDSDGFRPSWLNQITFWTIAIFVVAGVWHSILEDRRRDKFQKWLAGLTEEDRAAYFRNSAKPQDDE